MLHMEQHEFHNPTATFLVVYDCYDSLHDCSSSLGRTMYEYVYLNMAAAQFSQCKLHPKASFWLNRKSHWKTNGRKHQICSKSSKFLYPTILLYVYSQYFFIKYHNFKYILVLSNRIS